MRKSALAVGFILALGGVGIAAQNQPNFSGNWVLDREFQPSATVPRALSVQQEVKTANVPSPPASISVERQFADRVQLRYTDYIGVPGGVAGGGPGVTPRPVSRLVRWDGAALRFERTELTALGEVVRRTTEVWRLDDRDRLVITIENQEGNTVDTRTVAFREVR